MTYTLSATARAPDVGPRTVTDTFTSVVTGVHVEGWPVLMRAGSSGFNLPARVDGMEPEHQLLATMRTITGLQSSTFLAQDGKITDPAINDATRGYGTDLAVVFDAPGTYSITTDRRQNTGGRVLGASVTQDITVVPMADYHTTDFRYALASSQALLDKLTEAQVPANNRFLESEIADLQAALPSDPRTVVLMFDGDDITLTNRFNQIFSLTTVNRFFKTGSVSRARLRMPSGNDEMFFIAGAPMQGFFAEIEFIMPFEPRYFWDTQEAISLFEINPVTSGAVQFAMSNCKLSGMDRGITFLVDFTNSASSPNSVFWIQNCEFTKWLDYIWFGSPLREVLFGGRGNWFAQPPDCAAGLLRKGENADILGPGHGARTARVECMISFTQNGFAWINGWSPNGLPSVAGQGWRWLTIGRFADDPTSAPSGIFAYNVFIGCNLNTGLAGANAGLMTQSDALILCNRFMDGPSSGSGINIGTTGIRVERNYAVITGVSRGSTAFLVDPLKDGADKVAPGNLEGGAVVQCNTIADLRQSGAPENFGSLFPELFATPALLTMNGNNHLSPNTDTPIVPDGGITVMSEGFPLWFDVGEHQPGWFVSVDFPSPFPVGGTVFVPWSPCLHSGRDFVATDFPDSPACMIDLGLQSGSRRLLGTKSDDGITIENTLVADVATGPTVVEIQITDQLNVRPGTAHLPEHMAYRRATTPRFMVPDGRLPPLPYRFMGGLEDRPKVTEGAF